MPNTYLFRNTQTGEYAVYRPWDHGEGSLTIYVDDLGDLAERMMESVDHFKEPFDLFGEVPEIDFGNLPRSHLAPLEDKKIEEIRRELAI